MMVIMGAIACNEQEEDLRTLPSEKNLISLSAQVDANETGETMTRLSVSNFPNAVGEEAQVAILAYATDSYSQYLYINHEKANVVSNGLLPYYYLAWQKGKEQYWPGGEELLITAYNPLSAKDDKSDNQLKIALHPEKWENTLDVIAADPVTAKYAPSIVVDLSLRHIMSSLNIKMKKEDEDVQLDKIEILIDGNQSIRFYNLKTALWENSTALTPPITYPLNKDQSSRSTPIDLNSTPILLFPGMEQFVTLKVYKKPQNGIYDIISVRLNNVKDNTGAPVSLLLPGIKSTLTLTLTAANVFSVESCILQKWNVVNAGNATLTTQRRIEIKMQTDSSLDSSIYEEIRGIKIISNGKEYSAIVTSTSPLTLSAFTENLKELPQSLGDQSRLVIYMKDNSMWEIPFSQYECQYNQDSLVLTINNEALNQ
jgi:hypothetical protein